MIVSDEEKRWIVVGIALNKVAAPVLRDAVTKGMDNNYADLDRHCKHSTPPSTLGTLNYGNVRADPAIFRNLKFQNINNNNVVHGLCNYNFNINSAVDLAKLYLPGYLAQFSAFDESLDMTAILRLLGFKMYMPSAVFSLHTQASADDVRENVRNKWGHVDLTEWTDALFNDCFAKLETLLKSLGLTTAVEKKALEQLADWKSKGCQLIVENSVLKDILHLVQDEVRDLIKDYKTMESQLNLQTKQVSKVSNDVSILQEYSENRGKEIKNVLKELQSLKAQLFIRLQEVEEGLADTNDRVEQLEQNQDLLHERCDKADDKVDQIEDELTKLKEGTSKPDANEGYKPVIINNTGNVAVGSSSKIVIIGNNVNSAQPPCLGGKGLRDRENMSGTRFSSKAANTTQNCTTGPPPPPLPRKKKMPQGDEEDLHQKQMQYNQQREGRNSLVSDDSSDQRSDSEITDAANTTQNCTTGPPPLPQPRKKKMLQGDEEDLHQKQMQYNQQPEGRNSLVSDDSSDERSDSEITDGK